MKVRELIEKLKEFNPDTEVLLSQGCADNIVFTHISSVHKDSVDRYADIAWVEFDYGISESVKEFVLID